jgi:hypothetical protein
MGVPKALGGALAEALLDGARHWAELRSPESKALNYQKLVETTCRTLGCEWDQVVAAVKPVLARLSKENQEAIRSSGALENPTTIVRLYSIARIQNSRPK